MSKSILVSVTNDLNQDQRMHRICDTLQNAGFDVLLFGRKKTNSQSLYRHSFKQKRLYCFFQRGVLFYLEFNIRLLLFAIQFKPDIYYSVDLDTLLGMGLAAGWQKKILIHDAHEYFVEVPELEGSAIKKKIWNTIGTRFIPKCDLCITVNYELSEILTQKYNNQFEVIRSVPKMKSEYELPYIKNKGQKVILYQGVLNKGRGLEEAILAVSSMKEDFVLKIAGEGDLSKYLRAYVEELNAHEKVEFLGWLDPKALKEETSKAHIGLNLLDGKSLNYKYSLANKFFDYMHAEVPSINMDFPVYSRICKFYKVGECIPDLKVQTIQAAIRSILSSEEQYQKYKFACIDARFGFSWENESRHLIQLMWRFK